MGYTSLFGCQFWLYCSQIWLSECFLGDLALMLECGVALFCVHEISFIQKKKTFTVVWWLRKMEENI
jgi:hypothetical protein